MQRQAAKPHPKGPGGRGTPGKGPGGLPAGAITLESHPIVYLNVPKSACTTIKNHLYFMEHGRYIDEPLDIHWHNGLIRSRQVTPEIEEIFRTRLRKQRMVFTFVRHPGKRAYSCFSEKIMHESKYSFPKVRDFIVERHGLRLPESESAGYGLELHRQNFLSFLQFVFDNFAGRNEIRPDAHWGRQTQILQHFQRHFFIDAIGRVERFEAQFAQVLDEVPMRHRPDLKVRFNEGPKPPFSYEEVVDAQVEERLQEIYADDYMRLGYAST